MGQRGIIGWSVAFAACLLSVCTPVRAQVPQPGAPQGVDVSHYNGAVDWQQVAASGISFAFVRAYDGLFADDRFTQNYAGAAQAGLIRGAYQFFEPGQDATAQANALLAAIGPLGAGDLAPVLDVEVTGGQSPAQLLSGVQTWVNVIGGSTGREPIIYANAQFWNTSVQGAVPGTDLWVAQWAVARPIIPHSWPAWTFWQYTIHGQVPGIAGIVDRDVFAGSPEQLQRLAGIPEPASWALMITGFGAMGSMLRRRRAGFEAA